MKHIEGNHRESISEKLSLLAKNIVSRQNPDKILTSLE